MKNHLSFDMVLQKFRIQIPSNIKYALIFKAMLSQVQDHTIKVAINQLKNEYRYGLYADQINTEAKLDHVQNTLEKIAQRKYHFDKANIDQAEKINNFYYEANIQVGPNEKKFSCPNCNARVFSSNSALHSHLRSCRRPFMDIQNIQIVRNGEQVLKRQKPPQPKRDETIKIDENQFMDEQLFEYEDDRSDDQIFEQEDQEK